MYLKSLTLKGFKSFADRTVMKFEPGVAAIVGPNGSGKSNISDAVLWVLGERNAKNLRGQSMEDVIFSGSSARKPVSVAEVELLLDNSDGTLPVDFAEVSIGRRMYRSGESEYLINGNVVRRMDVLDVLHDSGLGTGTNSIISQGNLDSVLSSRPEDRRALIEEAAGILKHKERKAKSERKLAQMDAHLDRVNDITAEVERQLKPLERKAKKARTYQGLADELADLRLRLAVDDLRILQEKMGTARTSEEELVRTQAAERQALSAAEAELDALQRQLQERGRAEGGLNERYRRAQGSFERLNSTAMLLREKRSGYQSEAERVSRQLEEGRARHAATASELESARAQATEARGANKAAQKKRGDLEISYQKRVNERNDLRREVDTLMSEQRGLVHRQETLQATQEALRENLSEKRTRAQVIDAHVADAAERLRAAHAQEKATAAEAARLAGELATVRTSEGEARSKMSALVVSRDEARRALDGARDAYTQCTAERAALEELERASDAANPALALLVGDDSPATPLTHALSVPPELEALVEALLGADVHALLVSGRGEAEELVGRVRTADVVGEVALVDAESAVAPGAALPYRRLADEVEVDAAFAAQVDALLGDVYVVDRLADALDAHRAHAAATFAALDGCIVWPTGKITLSRQSAADRENSALARRRALETARADGTRLKAAYDQAQERGAALEEELRGAQTAALKLSESLANLTGQSRSADAVAAAAKSAAANLVAEHERLLAEQKENRAFLDKARPDFDGIDADLAKVAADLAANKAKVDELQKTLSPLQRQIVALSEQVSDARLDAARLSERQAYAERLVASRTQELDAYAHDDDAAKGRLVVARGAAVRADALLATLSSLSDAASLLSARLEQASRDEQERSAGLHDRLTEATRASREVRERFEGLSARLSEVRIEKGRLEVQVETGIKAIVEECGTSLETALALDPLENRAVAAERAGSLERRIKNMGTINPDAAEEFERVSERYAYLSSQLDDMRQARRSLARIVGVIDDRMRDDFVVTFNRVNDNFSSIFSTLFPGGQAHLSLVDPDDLENTGVDVNAQPIGKRVKKMSLLSGGEKSMTAMALLFAVYRIRSTPFYILDEVEAALDDSNLRRLLVYLNVIRDETQFIMITHQRRTMESADILYGVSMQADGITKVISQKLDNAAKEG